MRARQLDPPLRAADLEGEIGLIGRDAGEDLHRHRRSARGLGDHVEMIRDFAARRLAGVDDLDIGPQKLGASVDLGHPAQHRLDYIHHMTRGDCQEARPRNRLVEIVVDARRLRSIAEGGGENPGRHQSPDRARLDQFRRAPDRRIVPPLQTDGGVQVADGGGHLFRLGDRDAQGRFAVDGLAGLEGGQHEIAVGRDLHGYRDDVDGLVGDQGIGVGVPALGAEGFGRSPGALLPTGGDGDQLEVRLGGQRGHVRGPRPARGGVRPDDADTKVRFGH